MIQPTIGRVVLFHPAPNRLGSRPSQPWPALVAFVHHDRSVNLGGFMHNGEPFSATNVPLMQDDDVASEGDAYAEWMPYQKEAAQRAAVSAVSDALLTSRDPLLAGALFDKALEQPEPSESGA